MSWHTRQWAELIGALGAGALTLASGGAFGPAAAAAVGGSAGAGAGAAGAGALTAETGGALGGTAAADAAGTAGWGSLLGGAATKAATGVGTNMGLSLLTQPGDTTITNTGQPPPFQPQSDPFDIMRQIQAKKKGGF